MAESKLTHDQRTMVLRMHAEGYRYADIQRQLKVDFDISLHHETIRSTCDAKINQPFIERFRTAYLNKISEVPIANKRVRIDDLEKVREKILRVIERNPLETRIQRNEFLAFSTRLVAVVQQAREEVEKRPDIMNNFSVTEFSSMSDEDLKKAHDELLAKVRRSLQQEDKKQFPLLEDSRIDPMKDDI
ncbi:MAG: hypothetical protein H6753_07115 [Candidatus Omnitrophica bacterium]|nr:hypothetical protein [Candidatus Omnitrophota bacterium]